MKKQMLLTSKACLGFPLIMTLVAGGQAAAQSENSRGGRYGGATPIIFQAAGPSIESIQSTVDAYREALGETNNANNPGPLGSGRREINWDGGGSDATTPPVTPFDVFLDSRGAQFTTPGEGLTQAPPEFGPQGGLRVLFNNETYDDIFRAFSPLRLFTPVSSNITEAKFFVPGTDGETPARVCGFGAVFTDVDRQDGSEERYRKSRGASTLIEYYGANKRLLFRAVVPASPGDASFSFFGVVFEEAIVAKVRITTGNAAPGPDDNERRDIVMMDDFIYGEPQSEDGNGMAESPSEETAGITAATDESTSSTEDEGTTTAEDEGTTSAAGESQILTVVNGSASGNTPGTVVTVTANDPPTGQEFAGWTGDVDILANSSLSTTTATLPSTTQVTITATYRSASATQP